MTACDGHWIQDCNANSTLCRNVPAQKLLSKSSWTSNYIWLQILQIPANLVLLPFPDKQLLTVSSGFKPELLPWSSPLASRCLFPFSAHNCCECIFQAWWCSSLPSLKPRNTSRNPPTTLKVLIHFPKTGRGSLPYPQHLLCRGTNLLDYEVVSCIDSNSGDHVQPAQTWIHFYEYIMYEGIAIQVGLKKKKLNIERGKSQITCPASYHAQSQYRNFMKLIWACISWHRGLAGGNICSILSENKWYILKDIPHQVLLNKEGHVQPHTGSGARAFALCLPYSH